MLAISAWFDDAGESAVRDLWRAISEAGVDGSLHDGPYRPHITLGVWEELVVEAAATRLASVVAGRAAVEARFRAIGIFPPHPVHRDVRRHAAVWLAPTVTLALRELHEAVHAAIDGTGAWPVHHHLPGRWNAPCTLAWGLEPDAALSAAGVVLDAGALPLTATDHAARSRRDSG